MIRGHPRAGSLPPYSKCIVFVGTGDNWVREPLLLPPGIFSLVFLMFVLVALGKGLQAIQRSGESGEATQVPSRRCVITAPPTSHTQLLRQKLPSGD